MSGELEAAGAAITAGLAARTIEGGHQPGGDQHGACLNCQTPLAGEFCHVCGQPAHISRTLGDVWHDALHGLLHFDAKAWRTLPLLVFRPGTLTSRYIHGQRARFISPMALFLFTIFLMFFVFSLAGANLINVQTGGIATIEDAQEAEDTARAELAEALAEADVALAEGGESDATAARVRVAAAQVAVASTERATQQAEAGDSAGATDVAAVDWRQQWRDSVAEAEINIIPGDEATNEHVREKLMNPDLVIYKLQQTAYKFSFLLVPISIPFIALLFFWKRGVTLFDHVVFSLYSLSFMSLLFVFLSFVSRAPEAISAPLLGMAALAPPVHLFFQLKGGYGLGWFSALWRTLVLGVFLIIAFSLFCLAIVFVGLLG